MICLKAGRVIDPASGVDEIRDIHIKDGRIAAPGPAAETIDVSGKIVMAGAIDIHSHIAGGNVGAARLLLPGAQGGQEPPPEGQRYAGVCYPASETGRLYAQMGFTTVVEPAMNPQGALRTHLELADIPYIDRGALAILGNEAFVLRLIKDDPSGAALRDYVAWSVATARALGVKTINPGGAAAFKENARAFGLDDVIPSYGLSSRAIFTALQRAVHAAGVAHPLHLHTNNLGMPGNVETALDTIKAADGLPLHLAHVQFYSYGATKKGGYASAAGRLAEAVIANKNITVDIGQVAFGQTITISSDVLLQWNSRAFADPKKWIVWEGEGNGGGVLPYRYREDNPVAALQWAIGLELFLLIDDPWRVFFTTDHPNGGPFTAYPKILHLLMDAGERARFIERLPPKALKTSVLKDLKREYSLYEIAVMTRAAPAKLLGLADRGRLSVGAVADIAVYTEQADKTAMFAAADAVFKNGRRIVDRGRALTPAFGRTLYAAPGFDAAIAKRAAEHAREAYGAVNVAPVPDAFAGREAPVFERGAP
ncbi:MAG: formylmethanofuran dehydrogenase subunit A [Hyphomicrobiales bacterium]|nr:formylmethanofuran dehydrogenase subunit A [Hyphomicrobiales bacterium]